MFNKIFPYDFFIIISILCIWVFWANNFLNSDRNNLLEYEGENNDLIIYI